MTLFKELKRRNVFKVASVYLVTTWLVLQVVSVVSPYLKLPVMFGTVITVVLLLAFPFVCIFAWAYELTPEGLRRTRDVEPEESIVKQTSSKINVALAIALGLSLAFISYTQWFIGGVDSNKVVTIAVLPFDDMSQDSTQGYFGDGIAEELLNALARNKQLRVTARTSSFAFKDQNKSIGDIASILGVKYVLEGSIRKANNTFRITAQLIDATNDYHLWSQTFDRPIDDIFAVQEELTRQITQALEVQLLPESETSVTYTTNNIQAYELYLQANTDYYLRSAEATQRMMDNLDKALVLDPDFEQAKALLYKGLSRALSYLNYPEELVQEQKGQLFAELVASKSDFSDKFFVIANHLYTYFAAQDASSKALETALALNPSNIDAHLFDIIFLDNEAKLERFEQLTLIAPADMGILRNIASTAALAGDEKRIESILSKIEAIDPSSHLAADTAVTLYYELRRKPLQALAYLQQPQIKHSRFTFRDLVLLTLLSGNIDEALAAFQQYLDDHISVEEQTAEIFSMFIASQSRISWTQSQTAKLESHLASLSPQMALLVQTAADVLVGNHDAIVSNTDLLNSLDPMAWDPKGEFGFRDGVLLDYGLIMHKAGKLDFLPIVKKEASKVVNACKTVPMHTNSCIPILLFTDTVTADDGLNLLKTSLESLPMHELAGYEQYMLNAPMFFSLHSHPEFKPLVENFIEQTFGKK